MFTFRRAAMKRLIHISLTLCLFVVTGCKANLVEDIYSHTWDENQEEVITAFIALSNITLVQDQIELIVKDYNKETSSLKKFLYEFLLAKRTQEDKYIHSFIAHAKENISIIIENKSLWISVSSPVYQQLALYARTNDEALAALIQFSKASDGAMLSVISEDLGNMFKLDPGRIKLISEKNGVQLSELLILMEEE